MVQSTSTNPDNMICPNKQNMKPNAKSNICFIRNLYTFTLYTYVREDIISKICLQKTSNLFGH